jgi:hypothetical protein
MIKKFVSLLMYVFLIPLIVHPAKNKSECNDSLISMVSDVSAYTSTYTIVAALVNLVLADPVSTFSNIVALDGRFNQAAYCELLIAILDSAAVVCSLGTAAVHDSPTAQVLALVGSGVFGLGALFSIKKVVKLLRNAMATSQFESEANSAIIRAKKKRELVIWLISIVPAIVGASSLVWVAQDNSSLRFEHLLFCVVGCLGLVTPALLKPLLAAYFQAS